MMPTWLVALVLLAYASLLVELTLLHVPSVASSRSIWARSPAVVAGYSPSYRAVFSFSRAKKILLFVLPLGAVFGAYLYPLTAIWSRADFLGDYAFAPSLSTDVLAALLIALGRCVALTAVVAMRRLRATPESELVLQTGGPFRHSRNPGLVGMYTFLLGLWVTTPSLTMLVAFGVYVLYMDFKVRMEEDYLRNRFGPAYLEYCRRTSRYWP